MKKTVFFAQSLCLILVMAFPCLASAQTDPMGQTVQMRCLPGAYLPIHWKTDQIMWVRKFNRPSPSVPPLELLEVDITGKQPPRQSTLWRHLPPLPTYWLASLTLSPNHQWGLTLRSLSVQKIDAYHFQTGQHLEWNLPVSPAKDALLYRFVSPPHWMPDNQHWIGVLGNDLNRVFYRVVGSLQSAPKVQMTPMKIHRRMYGHWSAGPSVKILGALNATQVLGFSSDATMGGNSLSLYAINLTGTPPYQYLHRLPIGIQNKTTVLEVAYSPASQQLAILAEERYARTCFTEILICKLDGSEMSSLWSSPDTSPDHSNPVRLAWVPSGKALSFQYKDAWWRVPVPVE